MRIAPEFRDIRHGRQVLRLVHPAHGRRDVELGERLDEGRLRGVLPMIERDSRVNIPEAKVARVCESVEARKRVACAVALELKGRHAEVAVDRTVPAVSGRI